ncbi:MAG: hypothetical protein ACR2LQ_03255 [Acidimicrobiales bacterium]
MGRERAEQGQVLPIVAVIVLVAVGAALVLVRLGVRASDQAKAQTAADAAALAGAVEGRAAAQQLAAANGSTLVSFEDVAGGVRVTVRVGDAVASARADRTGQQPSTAYSGADALGPTGRGHHAGRSP